jgi:uncharacterized membrane protein
MIGLSFVYVVMGLIFAAYAGLSAARRRFGNAAFWGLVALSFFAGDRIGDFGNGLLVIALVAIAGLKGVRKGVTESVGTGRARGNGLFLAALIVPAVTVLGTWLFKQFPDLVDPRQVTLVALTLAVLIALAACFIWLRPAPSEPFREGLRLMDGVGWATVLPQMLASLGAVFALAGVGNVVGGLMGHAIPDGSLIAAVLAYAIGMALFTIVMGNAFAAFPVMAAAIGVPLLIRTYHGDPAIVAAIGMLAGFCGTLLTPMAANFNIVPAALLDLKDRYGVIRAQVGTAIPLLMVNIALLYFLAFR